MMRSPRRIFLQRCLVLATLLSTSHALNLSQLQEVSGFSSACTNAYNTPLTDCTLDEFLTDKGCSLPCVAFLERLTVTVIRACKGTTAFPDTLIGMIFSGSAVQKLCPNFVGRPSGSGDAETSSSTSLTRSPATSQTRAGPSTKANTNTRISVSDPSQSSISSTMASSSTRSPTATSPSLITTSPSLQSISTSLPLRSTIPLSLLTLETSTARTSRPEPTSTTQPAKGNSQGGGGGTPFDIVSLSCRATKTIWWAVSIPVVVYLLGLLV